MFEIAEPGGITANFLAKVPGATMELGPASLEFHYEESFCTQNQLEAYERLIHDAMIGDATLFNRADGIERLWEIATPLLERPAARRAVRPGLLGAGVDSRASSPPGAGTFPTAAESRAASRRAPRGGGVA